MGIELMRRFDLDSEHIDSPAVDTYTVCFSPAFLYCYSMTTEDPACYRQ